jgi:GT2 family glycosyltransferase
MFPDVLQTLVDYLDTHADVGAVTGRMTFADGTPQYTCSQFADYTDFLLSYTFVGTLLHGWRDRRRRIMWYDGWQRDSTRAIEVAPGSLILARRAILNQIDHFDEQLKLFFTDDDLCRRIIGTGCKIHFVGGPTIIHDEHTSLKQVPQLTQQVYLADLITYTRKYHGPVLAFILALLLIPTRMVMSFKRWRQK